MVIHTSSTLVSPLEVDKKKVQDPTFIYKQPKLKMFWSKHLVCRFLFFGSFFVGFFVFVFQIPTMQPRA